MRLVRVGLACTRRVGCPYPRPVPRAHSRSLGATAPQQPEPRVCWRCGCALAPRALFCDCASPPALQPIAHTRSCFQLLCANPGVNVDAAQLDKTFKDLQRVLHPDLFAQRSAHEQDLAAANSALVNQAYQKLKTPLGRVKHLLELHDIDALSEDGRSSTLADPVLLMEVMDTRQSVEEAPSRAALADIAKENAEKIEVCLAALHEHYSRGEIDLLAGHAIRLQYFTKIDEEIEAAMERC